MTEDHPQDRVLQNLGQVGPRLEQTECAFCAIVAGTAPATVVREWPEAVAFADIDPLAAGHVQVVPRRHVAHAAVDPTLTAMVMGHAAEIAAQWPASNILTSIGAAAIQSVFHLHIHVVPRAPGDGLMLPWGTTGDPHDPHWCRVAEGLQREVDERYPRRCSQCGQRWADQACGPSHAIIAGELGLGDLRRTLAARTAALAELARLKDGPRAADHGEAKDQAWIQARRVLDGTQR